MDCTLCKVGSTQAGKVTITLEKNGSIILIKDVPAEVCANCGHYYLTESTSKLVLEKGTQAIKSGAELEVFKLQSA